MVLTCISIHIATCFAVYTCNCQNSCNVYHWKHMALLPTNAPMSILRAKAERILIHVQPRGIIRGFTVRSRLRLEISKFPPKSRGIASYCEHGKHMAMLSRRAGFNVSRIKSGIPEHVVTTLPVWLSHLDRNSSRYRNYDRPTCTCSGHVSEHSCYANTVGE